MNRSLIRKLSVFLFALLLVTSAQASLGEVLLPAKAKLVLRALKTEVNKGYLKCNSPQYPDQTDFAFILTKYLQDNEVKITLDRNSVITLEEITQTESRKNLTRAGFSMSDDLKTLVGVKLNTQAILIRTTNLGDLLNPVFQETEILMNQFDLNCK